jgi:hypothetical protein
MEGGEVMAKKAPAKKAPAKRKPRPKKPPAPVLPDGQYNSVVWNPELQLYVVQPKLPAEPVVPVLPIVDPTDYGEPVKWKWLSGLAMLLSPFLFVGVGVWMAGGIHIGGDVPVADAVSEVFDTQEAAFRKLNGELAQKLIAGEIKSENEARTWMESNFLPQSDAAWIKLLESEKAQFGGDKWTAEKQAAVIGRYAR